MECAGLSVPWDGRSVWTLSKSFMHIWRMPSDDAWWKLALYKYEIIFMLIRWCIVWPFVARVLRSLDWNVLMFVAMRAHGSLRFWLFRHGYLQVGCICCTVALQILLSLGLNSYFNILQCGTFLLEVCHEKSVTLLQVCPMLMVLVFLHKVFVYFLIISVRAQ